MAQNIRPMLQMACAYVRNLKGTQVIRVHETQRSVGTVAGRGLRFPHRTSCVVEDGST